MSGYFLLGSKSRGYRSQPWISKPPFFQWRLLASPQAGLMDLLRCVICAQLAVGSAQTSGGALNELRMTAELFASSERERLMPHAPAVIWPASRKSSVLLPSAGLIVASGSLLRTRSTDF